LGIAQREIKARRIPDRGITRHRKATPKEVKTLGDQLKKARLEQGLTQRQVSAITGIPRNRLQEIERDDRVPSPEDWKRLADAAGI
jgi:ribosome-binding protein aMBF1 (putative translation factor)